jgi:hypothetical protein
MRIAKLVIHNVLGIEHFELAPGSISVIEGANGVGKTSILKAIDACIHGGRDATLLRKGAEKGEIVLVLDDGTEISRPVKPDGLDGATVKHPTFGKIAKPQSYLDKLADALSVNPVAFILAPAPKRAEWLLEVLPVTVSDEDLQGTGVTELPSEGRNGLERIELARKAVYDERTGVNRAAKEKRATITQLRATVPAGAPGVNPETEAREAEGQAAAHTRALSTAVETIRSEESQRVDAVNAETDAAIRKLETDRTEELARIRQQSTDHREAAATDYQPKIDAAQAIVAGARERAQRFAADEKAREWLKKHESEAAVLEERSATLTETLEKLDILKAKALENLPIKGVEVRDGDVFVDGIPFEHVNKAKQVRVALNVARLRAGQLGLVCVDGLEALDSESFAAFEKAAEKTGLQFVVSRVTAGPLVVRAGGTAA